MKLFLVFQQPHLSVSQCLYINICKCQPPVSEIAPLRQTFEILTLMKQPNRRQAGSLSHQHWVLHDSRWCENTITKGESELLKKSPLSWKADTRSWNELLPFLEPPSTVFFFHSVYVHELTLCCHDCNPVKLLIPLSCWHISCEVWL